MYLPFDEALRIDVQNEMPNQLPQIAKQNAMVAQVNEEPNQLDADIQQVPQVAQQCFVRLQRLSAAAPRFQPYAFRHARRSPERENYVRIRCAVCRRIFRMYDVPADFDVDGNICSVECYFYDDSST